MNPKKAKAKTERACKPPERRAAECLLMARQLSEFGLSHADPGIAKVLQILDEFVETGSGFTGTVVTSNPDVAVHAKLSKQPHIESWLRVSRRPGA
jgi:hypothetical protein